MLINNAGIMALPDRELTAQNFEKQFGVNHMGHFLLTKLLLEKVKKSEQGKIINLASSAHTMGKFDFDDLNRQKEYTAWGAYGQSKLANIYFTRHLDSLLKKESVSNVKVVSLHPGVVNTELGRYMGMNPVVSFGFKLIGPLFLKTPIQGAQTSLHCALLDFDKLESGKYYSDSKVTEEKMPNENWSQEAEKLWDVSEKAVEAYV